MKDYKFSIIIPCYNIADDVESTIRSVLNQSYRNYEIIIVNDGSADNTLDVVNKFKDNVQIKIVDKKNGGVSSARNIGIEKARGEFLLFLDGGDLLKDSCLNDIEKSITKDIDIISFGYEKIKDDKSEFYSLPIYNNRFFNSTDFLTEYFQHKIKQCMCSFVVRRSLVVKNEIKFNEATYNGEDQEFQIKCMFNSSKIKYLSSVYFQYIVNQNSATTTISHKYLTLIDVFDRLQKEYKHKFIDRKLLKAFNNYALLEYFYVFNLFVKYGNKALVNKIISKDNYLDKFDLNLSFSRIFIIVFFSFSLYKISPSLLIKVYKKI